MPAIHIDRLNQQINAIFDPESPGKVFRANFKNLLEIHANLAYKAGNEIHETSRLPKYHLPLVVQKQLQQRFLLLVKINPKLALEYADQLWLDEIYETKYFSGIILGALPVSFSDEILNRLVSWSSQTPDKEIVVLLFDEASKSIRHENSNQWLGIIQNWIDSNDTKQILAAIIALQTTINDSSFINLPRIFNILTPLFSFNNRRIIAGLTSLVSDLANINPGESSSYLITLLLRTSYPSPKQIVRKCLKQFPEENQKKLRQVLSSLTEEI